MDCYAPAVLAEIFYIYPPMATNMEIDQHPHTNEDTSFDQKLEAVEALTKELINSPEYMKMMATGYMTRCDYTLGDALHAIQECWNDYTLTTALD